MQNLKSKTVSSLFWKLMERGGNAVVSLVVQIVMARLLTPEDFGVLAIIIVFVNIGAVFVQSGLNSALIQAPQVDSVDYSTGFWTCLFISVALFALIFFCAPYIGIFYNNAELVWPLRVISLLLVFNAYNSIQMAKITRDLELKKTFHATLVSVFASGAAGIVLAYMGAGIWALVVQQLLYQLVNCVALDAQIDWRPRLCFSFNRASRLFRFGWKLLAAGIINTVYKSLSSLIIGKQFSQYDLGLVSQGEKYPQAIGNMIDGAIQPVMFSAVSRVQESLGSVKELTKRALKTSSFLVIPIMGMVALVAESFVLVFLGEQWLPAVPFLQMYCFIYALYPIQTSNLQVANGLGRSDVYLKIEIVKKIYGVIIIVVAAFVLENVYAVVIGLMLSSLISVFVNSIPSSRFVGYGIIEQFRDIVPSVLLTALSASLAYCVVFLCLAPLPTLVLQCLVMAVSYIAFSALFKVEEFAYLLSTFKEMVRRRGA